MDFFSAMEIAASGLRAQRVRMNVLASNLANARTTRTAAGGPYRRLDPVFEAVPLRPSGGVGPSEPASLVNVARIQQDNAPPQMIYDPTHPDADPQGFVQMPNVNVVEEMVNLITASRSYESGVTVLQSVKSMMRSALHVGA